MRMPSQNNRATTTGHLPDPEELALWQIEAKGEGELREWVVRAEGVIGSCWEVRPKKTMALTTIAKSADLHFHCEIENCGGNGKTVALSTRTPRGRPGYIL